MIPKLTVYAKYLLMVLIVEINCFSQNVQLQSACSNKFVRVEKDRVIANENSEYPQNFTITSDTIRVGEDDVFRITFYIKELEAYICFNKRWQPRLFKKLSENCYFKEEMDGGYFLFHSIEHPGKYLGFSRNGRPVNYNNTHKIDKHCRKIFKRITEDSSNGFNTQAIEYEPTSLANGNTNDKVNYNHHHHRHKSSTRIHQRTHSNRIDTTKQRSSNSASTTTEKRNKLHSQSQTHPVRHHHNEQPLRRYHTISNNKDNKYLDSNDNKSSTKQLGNEDSNAIYNEKDVNITAANKIKQNARPSLRKPTHGDAKASRDDVNVDRVQNLSSDALTNFKLGNNNSDTNNNCTDETDDKSLKGRKIVKGRNAAHANDKPNNKCNNNNRRLRKNNENGRIPKRPSQKSQSHKNLQQTSP